MEQMTFRELTDKMMILYREGKYNDALQLIEQNKSYFPEQAARTTFWQMCLSSLCNRPEEVISIFRQGLDAGLWWGAQPLADPDLNAVRDLPEFKRLMAISQEKYEEAQAQIERDRTILLPDLPASGTYPLLIALHGLNGNKDSHLEHWEAARQRGWLVLSTQSAQASFPAAYGWDNPAKGLADLHFYYEQVVQQYPIDQQRTIVAGFSQGSGMAIYAALKGNLPVRGFVGIGTWWADASEFSSGNQTIRGYFVTGEKDQTLDRAREIQVALRKNKVQFGEEVHPNLGHEFPADFGTAFDKAIEFIFKERE